MSESQKVIMHRFVEEVINRGNLLLVDELVHPNYVDRSRDQELHGRENLKGFLASYLEAFPDLNLQIDDLVIEGFKAMLS